LLGAVRHAVVVLPRESASNERRKLCLDNSLITPAEKKINVLSFSVRLFFLFFSQQAY